MHGHFILFYFYWISRGLSIFFLNFCQSNTSWIYLSIYQSFRQASMEVKLSELKIQVKDVVRFKGVMRTSVEYSIPFFTETKDPLFWPQQNFWHCKVTLKEGTLYG